MEVNGRLGQSLHNAVRLSLGMERWDSAVSPPWEVTWYEPEKPPEPLPAGTRIEDVFHQKQRQLLILGEPGAGKTTTMLELARELLDAAKEDNTQPIPVLVSLSSWKQPDVGMFDWLVAELKDKYGLRQDLGASWLEKDRLLPLLDGLDEVAPVLQPQCAEAINTWLTGDIEKRPCGVLVCCRREEFETIVGKKLSVQGAIYLQPLTAMQIEEYFDGLKLSDVWQAVGEDVALQELLAKPLFLSMFGLVRVEGKFDLAAWQKRETSAAKIEYLFDTYWDAVMSRELILEPGKQNANWLSRTYKTKSLPQRKAVRRTLIFIAKGMERDSSIGTEFSIEQMQPSWLFKRKKILLGLIWGLIIGLMGGGTVILLFDLIFGLIFGMVISLVFSLIWGLIGGLPEIETIEEISIFMLLKSRRELKQQIFIYLVKSITGNMILGLIMGIMISVISGVIFNVIIGLIVGLLVGIFVGVLCGIFSGLIKGCKSEIEIKKQPNQGIKRSIKNMMILTMITAIAAFPIKFILDFLLTLTSIEPELHHIIISVILFVIIFTGCAFGGGYPFIQHIILRIVLWLNRYVPFRFDLLLDYCTERLLIQRIGGRYRFMHKLLQDHFAKMELD